MEEKLIWENLSTVSSAILKQHKIFSNLRAAFKMKNPAKQSFCQLKLDQQFTEFFS